MKTADAKAMSVPPTKTLNALSVLPWAAIFGFLGSYGWWLFIAAILLLIARQALMYLDRQWHRQRIVRLLQRLAIRLETKPVFYGCASRLYRVARIDENQQGGLELMLHCLDYSKHAPNRTGSISKAHTLRRGDLLNNANPLGRLTLPETVILPNGADIFARISEGSDYYLIASQQHQTWSLMDRLAKYTDYLSQEIQRVDTSSSKYINSSHLSGARARLSAIRQQKERQLLEASACIEKLGVILERLTLGIESIEDFGELLLGPSVAFQHDPFSPSRLPPSLDSEKIQQDLEEADLLIRSYDGMPQ